MRSRGGRGGAKASQTVMWLLYLCIKPEISEMQQKRFHAIVKVKNFTIFPVFPTGASEGLLYAVRVTIGQC